MIGPMTADKPGPLRSLVDGAASVARDVRESVESSRAATGVPVPALDAALDVKITYLEVAQVPVGRLEAPDGTDGSRSRGIATPLIALCRASADAHPDLVDAVVEPVLAHRRRLARE
jgi:hypothetical protein